MKILTVEKQPLTKYGIEFQRKYWEGDARLYTFDEIYVTMKCSVTTLLTLSTFLVSLTSQVSYAQETFSVLKEASFTEPVLETGVLTSYKTFVLDADLLKRIKNEEPDRLSLSIPSPDGGTFAVGLEKKNIFTSDFSVNTPGGKTENLDLGTHYSGKLSNDSRSAAAFSFYDNCLLGMVATDAGNYNVVFLRDAEKNPSNRYVVYNDQAFTIANPFHCATDDLPTVSRPHTQKSGESDDASRVACKTLRQYYECDYQMYLDNGSNVQNTVNWVTGMFNVVRYLYHNEQVTFRLSEVYVWDTPDNYPTTAEGALSAFGDTRQDNFNGDLGQLLSTRNVGNGGLAWVDVLCQDYWQDYSYGRYAYSNIKDSYNNLPLWSWTINCVTHETGHNLGSPHTHWCGWDLSPGHFGAIDSCYTTEDNNGTQCYNGPAKPIKGTIMSYCHLGLGTNLNLGFGPIPGNLIRQRVQQASCVATGNGPSAPQITGVLEYCVGDHIELSATAGQAFTWTGPNGFTSSSSTISIPVAETADAGLYIASITTSDCVLADYANVLVTNRPPVPQITYTGGALKCIPSSTSYTYQWYDAGGNPVGNNQSTYLPSGPGQYSVVISRNGCFSDESSKYNFNTTASVIENAAQGHVAVWPNPVSDLLFVQYVSEDAATLSIYDLNGRQLMQPQNRTGLQKSAALDISMFADGMYVLEIRSPQTVERIKFLVRK